MTPKDWDKIEKLLGPMADQKTVEAVKALVEEIETSLKGSLTANVVKSVQRGIVLLDASTKVATATINAVNMSKAVVVFTGLQTGAQYGGGEVQCHIELTNETTITVTRTSYGKVNRVPYQVVEYH